MVKIRIEGTLPETQEAVGQLQKCFTTLSVSAPYKNRGQSEYYRIYVDADLKKDEAVI